MISWHLNALMGDIVPVRDHAGGFGVETLDVPQEFLMRRSVIEVRAAAVLGMLQRLEREREALEQEIANHFQKEGV